MNLLKQAHRSINYSLQSHNFGQTHVPISLFMQRQSTPRHFSTEVEGDGQGVVPEPPPPPIVETFDSPDSASPIERILRQPTKGLCYAKVLGLNRNTLKSDVTTMFDGCNVTPDDVKFVYDRFFNLAVALVQFPSPEEYNSGLKAMLRYGRVFRLEKVDRSDWDFTKVYNGKYLLLQGMPVNSTIYDIDRFLEGFDFDASSIEMITRRTMPGKMAIIRFPSQIEAMNATIRKDRAFMQNLQVNARVLY